MLPQIRKHRKTQKPIFRSIFLISAASLTLSGCGWEWPKNESWEKDPLAFLGKNSTSDKNTPPPPVVIPPDAPDQNAPEAQLLPASTMGLNLQTYFAQDIQDPNLRLKRLENALVAVHEDMKKMSGVQPVPAYHPPPEPVQSTPQPASQPVGMQPIVESTNPAREVMASGGPESLVAGDTVKPPTAAPKKATPKPKAAAKPNAPVSGATAVSNLRIGEHADKVRIVMDLNKKTLYTADLDNAENLLVVELPDAGWNAAAKKSFGKLPVVESYRVDPYNDGAGNIVVFQLKKGTSILKQSQIPAHQKSGQRIFIDLAK